MNNKTLWQKLMPHLLILGAFLLITFIYFNPVLKGKALLQHDELMFKGMVKEIQDYRKSTDAPVLWTNSMFSGMPAYQISVGYPNSMLGLNWLYTFMVKYVPHPINTVFLYLAGFYLFLLAFRLNKWVAAIGAIAFAFSSYNFIIIDAGHVNKTYALAIAPMMLGAIVYTYRTRKYLLGAALFALAFAFELKTNHVQITYYMMILAGFLFLYEAYTHIKEKAVKPFLISTAALGVGALLAFGANFGNLYMTNEYAKQTIRGKSELTQKPDVKSTGLDKDYALGWSYGVGETGTLMIPDFRGGNSAAIGTANPDAVKDINPQAQQVVSNMDEYWGPQPSVSGPVYFGAIVCFLFILGMLVLNGPLRWWLLAATILSIMLSWGKNFMELTDLFFNYFPFYNKFRSVSMTLVIASIAMPVLAFIVVDKLLKIPNLLQEKKKQFYIALGLTAGLSLIFWLLPDMAGDFLKPENADMQTLQQMLQQANLPAEQVQQYMNSGIIEGLQEARMNILKEDAIRSFIFIILAAGLLWVYSLGKLKKEIVLAGLALLVLVDMSMVCARYLNSSDFKPKRNLQQAFVPSPADQYILQDTDPDYRVLNLTVSPFNDASTSYFHKSIGGYHGAKLRRYQELIENHIYKEINEKLAKNDLQGASVLNMLNTRYFITKPEADGVIRNPFALGNAWMISNIKLVDNADQEMAALNNFDARSTAIVNKDFMEYLDGYTQWSKEGRIKLDSYNPEHLVYSFDAPADQFVVFSEIYYNPHKDWRKNDWKAYIDGKEVEHIRANYVLRALKVPAGKHKIEFKFKPDSYYLSENISLVFSILLLLLIAGAIFYEVRKAKAEQKFNAA